ncbi:glycosyl transferase [Jannaschia pagri]|uniref:Glycosyl transferase n=1 Tax=Jannaschia pagri TaxID=2829797 RepID=A0ABQ4NJV4_9RHOB|nr:MULTISPECIES: glycosyltransferase [unclassified Jannaschia]GIT90871.1 glycosyl transferase [Jannaschia sp. AI_61]GIT94702.1 glycosyl transferase [Jannaschia sp. AI_62]
MGHIAILMGVHNGAAHLPAQLASITGQNHDAWSLHVSDDGSDDNSPEILRRFAEAYPSRVSLRAGPCRGGAMNFLTLLRDADLPKNAAVAWCDQDDVWLPDRLARAAAACEAMTPVFYATRYQLLLADGTRGAASAALARPVTFGNTLVQNPLPGHTMVANHAATAILRRAVPAALEAQVPHHDWWTAQIMLGAGAQVVFEERPSVLYRQHSENQVGTRAGLRAKLERLAMIADGRLSDWLDRNIAALRGQTDLTPDSAALLEAFTTWRETPAWRRPALARLGIWRQDRLGGLALETAARLGRV